MSNAALFDWDGTLLDSRDALLGAWHAASEQVLGRRFPGTPTEETLVFTVPGVELFPRVAGPRAAELSDAFRAAYAETGSAVAAFPGVAELLEELREAGVRVAVVTSKARARFARDLEHSGLAALVELAVCQEDTPTHKPEPAPLLLALERLGVAPACAAMVGDTSVDVQAGLAAGTVAFGVAWGADTSDTLTAAGAAAIATTAADLRALLRSAALEESPA